MEKEKVKEENIIHLLLRHPLKSKRLGIGVRDKEKKSKALLVISHLKKNIQMFVKKFYIKPQMILVTDIIHMKLQHVKWYNCIFNDKN